MRSRCKSDDIAKVDLSATVIICSECNECKQFNTLCLEMLDGNSIHYVHINV